MTRIERIQPSLHKKDRVLVYLTGGDLLRITPEELLRFGLRPGQELTEDMLEELRRAAEFAYMSREELLACQEAAVDAAFCGPETKNFLRRALAEFQQS
mgnify:CR=1 FL=1